MAAGLKKFDIKTVETLQAYMRGTLVRSKLSEVRQQFQDIVQDLDGPEYQVLWHSNKLTLSNPTIKNIGNHEKILSSQLDNKLKTNEVVKSDGEEEDRTITQENIDRQNCGLHDHDLTQSSVDFQNSVRENLEERFDIAALNDKVKEDENVGSCEIDENVMRSGESRCNSSDSTRGVTESEAAKVSEDYHRDIEDYEISNPAKHFGRTNNTVEVTMDCGNTGSTHMNQDEEDRGLKKDFKMTKESKILKKSSTSSKSDPIKTDNSDTHLVGNAGCQVDGNVAKSSGNKKSNSFNCQAKHSGYKQSEDPSDSQSDASLKSTSFQSFNNLEQNSHLGKTSPDRIGNDSFIHHSTPMLSQNTQMNDEELRRHPLLTESWMTDRSFDPVRSDDNNSSTSELSVNELQQRREQISMELLWTQQAIESRKNYLKLKQTLGKDNNSGT